MSKRRLDDWLTSFIEYSKNSEAPLSYHVWAGISTIAAAMQRKCFMYWHPHSIYPNNYVILVGPSGRSRKSDAITTARYLIEELNVKVIGEDNTQEALIREMKLSEQFFQDPVTGNQMPHSSVSCFAEEMAVFTGQQNATFLAYLTNWYDSRDIWTRRTKHQGTDKIIGMCFNLLISTAPDWLPGILTRESVGGGFTSRCVFVVEEGKRQTITNPNLHRPSESLRNDLIFDLEMIQMLVGEYTFDDEALATYEAWYADSDQTILRMGNPLGPMFDGYWSRRPTHIKKIAMALSASRGDSLVVTLSDFDRALAVLTDAEIKMPKVFSGIGRSKYAEDIDDILSYIKAKGEVNKAELTEAFYRNVDDIALEAITKILSDMKAIEIHKARGETFFRLVD
jgi:hypothetical protein